MTILTVLTKGLKNTRAVIFKNHSQIAFSATFAEIYESFANTTECYV